MLNEKKEIWGAAKMVLLKRRKFVKHKCVVRDKKHNVDVAMKWIGK